MNNLREDIGMTGAEEVVPQEEIADSGSDVGQPQNDVEEQPVNDGFDEVQEFEQQPISSSDLLNNNRKLKLYELFSTLLNKATIFLDLLNSIDINLLDTKNFKFIDQYTKNTKELIDKINLYMTKIFESEEYEKILYAYVLFRTELITNIKGIRDILKLDSPEEEI